MMRTLPDCPRCSEPDLYLYRALDDFVLSCAECGWRVTHPLIPDQDLDVTIAALVETYARLEHVRQIDPGDELPPFMVLALLGKPPNADSIDNKPVVE
jgi:hypothetical protein